MTAPPRLAERLERSARCDAFAVAWREFFGDVLDPDRCADVDGLRELVRRERPAVTGTGRELRTVEAYDAEMSKAARRRAKLAALMA